MYYVSIYHGFFYQEKYATIITIVSCGVATNESCGFPINFATYISCSTLRENIRYLKVQKWKEKNLMGRLFGFIQDYLSVP